MHLLLNPLFSLCTQALEPWAVQGFIFMYIHETKQMLQFSPQKEMKML